MLPVPLGFWDSKRRSIRHIWWKESKLINAYRSAETVLCIFLLLSLFKKPTLCLNFSRVNVFSYGSIPTYRSLLLSPWEDWSVALICTESRLTFKKMNYLNSRYCLVPISVRKVRLTDTLVWLIRIYPWTGLEVFCKWEKVNSLLCWKH